MYFDQLLDLVRSIDLSSNNLSREIHVNITSLVGLMTLILSGNHFIGRIP